MVASSLQQRLFSQLSRGSGSASAGNRLSLILFSILFMLWGNAGFSQTNYTVFELERGQTANWQPMVTRDLNGDGRLDLIVGHYLPEIGRELHIYHQQSDGTFANSPQRIEIKTEIIAVDFADQRSEPGEELLLFASNGVYSLSTALEGYAGNIKLLLQWELIATVPDSKQVQFVELASDINGDGLVDLLLPGDEIYGFFKGIGDESFELVSSFTTLNRNLTAAQRNSSGDNLSASISINPQQGVVIDVSGQGSSPFSGFIEQWVDTESNAAEESEKDVASQSQRSVRDRVSNSLLRTENWMATALLAALNSDELQDIIYLNVGDDGLGQLNIHYQDAETGFQQLPDWTGSINTSGDIQLVDMNQDQRMDLLRLSGNGNDASARLYLNHQGTFDLDQPDQVMRFSGYDVRLNFIALQAGSAPSLNVSYYTLPVIDVIRNASINRTQLVYAAENASPSGGLERLFMRRPASRLEESFSATNVLALAEPMSLHYDVDGDGSRDAMYITENGTLAAKHINAQLQIADQPFWEYVSANSVFEFEVLHLNGDNYPDLILRHSSTTSILVATP